jgi:hypothetical protein
VEGLVRIGGFGSAKQLGTLLALLDEYFMPAGTYDGLYEDLTKNGFGESVLEKIVELNLVEMHSGEFEIAINQVSDQTEVMEWFELTELGRKAFESIKAEAS